MLLLQLEELVDCVEIDMAWFSGSWTCNHLFICMASFGNPHSLAVPLYGSDLMVGRDEYESNAKQPVGNLYNLPKEMDESSICLV